MQRSRATSGRSPLVPEGNEQYTFVREGSLLGCRVVLLCLLLAMRGVRFFIEQPAQSCLDEQPRFEEMLRLIQVARRFCECLFVFVFNFALACCSEFCLARTRYLLPDGGWGSTDHRLRSPTVVGPMIGVCSRSFTSGQATSHVMRKKLCASRSLQKRVSPSLGRGPGRETSRP